MLILHTYLLCTDVKASDTHFDDSMAVVQLITFFTELQDLSRCKQIARQLCTQYIEGISSNPVTLKSRFRVTQGHWKRNHWIDHTQLAISRVI